MTYIGITKIQPPDECQSYYETANDLAYKVKYIVDAINHLIKTPGCFVVAKAFLLYSSTLLDMSLVNPVHKINVSSNLKKG